MSDKPWLRIYYICSLLSESATAEAQHVRYKYNTLESLLIAVVRMQFWLYPVLYTAVTVNRYRASNPCSDAVRERRGYFSRSVHGMRIAARLNKLA